MYKVYRLNQEIYILSISQYFLFLLLKIQCVHQNIIIIRTHIQALNTHINPHMELQTQQILLHNMITHMEDKI